MNMGQSDYPGANMALDNCCDYGTSSRSHLTSGRTSCQSSIAPCTPSCSESGYLDGRYADACSTHSSRPPSTRGHRIQQDIANASNFRLNSRRYAGAPSPPQSECSRTTCSTSRGSVPPEQPYYGSGAQAYYASFAQGDQYRSPESRPGRPQSVQSHRTATSNSQYSRASSRSASQSRRHSSSTADNMSSYGSSIRRPSSTVGDNMSAYGSRSRRSSVSRADTSTSSRRRTDRRYPPTSQHSAFDIPNDNYIYYSSTTSSGGHHTPSSRR